MLTPEPNEPSDDATVTPATTSVPIDLTGYELSPDPSTLRAYHGDEPEPELYVDGAGGLTHDPRLAVAPGAQAETCRGQTVDPPTLNPETPYSDVNGFYSSLAAPPDRKTQAGAQKTTLRPENHTVDSHPLPQTTNALAVVALVFALIGGALLAIVFGHVALSQIRRSNERGEGMAKAALIIGYLSLIGSVIFLIVSLATAGVSS